MDDVPERVVPVGELFMPPDVDGAREFFRQKSRAMTDKRMSVKDAVAQFINDGDYLATGGFGSVRFSTAVLHEIVRTRKKNLGFSGHSTTHDFEILAAGGVIDRCDIAYIVGLEMRGLSPNGRRVIESGKVPVAVLRPAEPHVRSLSESLRLAQEHAKELGYEPTLDPDFAADLKEIIQSRKPREISTWE
jgi:hypothetical protein